MSMLLAYLSIQQLKGISIATGIWQLGIELVYTFTEGKFYIPRVNTQEWDSWML